MNRQKLSQAMAATVASLSIIVFAYLFQPLQSAQSATPATTKQPTNAKTKRRKATIKPFAPPAPTVKSEKYMTQEKKQAIAAAKKKVTKAATAQTVQESQTSAVEEKKESKEEKKQAAAPITRNLIMIFDDGNDKDAMLKVLATGLVQQCAFILITQQLWELFKIAQIKTAFTDNEETDTQQLALHKILGDQSCTDIFFTPSEWDVYMTDDKDTNKQDRFYVFVPHRYISAELDNARDDKALGINISTLSLVKDPLKTTPTPNAAENNYYKGTVVANALQKILCPITTHPWNIYCTGHGNRGDRNTGTIAGLSIPAFENLMQFFNKPLMRPTNFFVYTTCFGGGEHLTMPFVTKGAATTLSYPIATTSLTDAPTALKALISTQDNPTLSFKSPTIAVLSAKTNCPVHFYSSINFDTFFKGLEAFANGTSKSNGLIITLNAVGGFLSPDLQKIKYLENIPQIRWPGTAWFQVSRLKNIPIIHLTRVNVMTQNYNALHADKTWELDATNKFVFLQNPDIAVPLAIDTNTIIVPLIHAIPFLQRKPLVIGNQKMPNLFAFTAPLTTTNGFFQILKTLYSLSTEFELANIALLANTFICANDLNRDQQLLLTANPVLQLEQVMINTGAPNVMYPNLTNTVMFAYNNKYFLIDMQQQNQLSQLDEKEAKQYQAIYKQCVDHCLDKSIEQLRTQNEKKHGETIINAATTRILEAGLKRPFGS